jgi:hypothetical protein
MHRSSIEQIRQHVTDGLRLVGEADRAGKRQLFRGVRETNVRSGSKAVECLAERYVASVE